MVVTWADALTAVGSIASPILVLVLGILLATRQARSGELLRTRTDYYKVLVPNLNNLMSYMTFIGTWRDHAPTEIVALKRVLDKDFFCAAPLFSGRVRDAYSDFLDQCFSTFNNWGEDARIVSSAYRRRQAWRRNDSAWLPEWDHMFKKAEDDVISAEELTALRSSYDKLLAALVSDLAITRPKKNYTTTLVSLNAHAPRARPVSGRSPTAAP